MDIINEEIFKEASNALKQLYGENASFREDQYEAIEAVVLGKRTLVVQKTGWGKSLVYFIATKLLKRRNNGITLVVSPLLALMENQYNAAIKLGLKTEVFNSTSKDRKESILNDLDNNNLDLLLITPETLFTNDFKQRLFNLNISCFVIDEAHCISDWGHDFRLEYSKLNKIVSSLSNEIPILATTATANNRVVEDLKLKLSTNLHITRGNLQRNNIAIQVLNFNDRTHRYAWLLKNLELLPGVGIIYCLTQRDCDMLTNFLNENGYNTLAYHSGIENAEDNIKIFESNKIKAIVSTIKLGMGYDKMDISFVIHFQQPNNLVSYYQQIGRAGRNIPFSYAILMNDKSDVEILESFIDNAFADEDISYNIINALKNGSMTITQMQNKFNTSLSKIKKALMFLENDEYVEKNKSEYKLLNEDYFYDKKHYDSITKTRKKELVEFNDYITTDDCYSKFIADTLDDPSSKNCGICSNCIKNDVYKFEDYSDKINDSLIYLNKLIIPILPKKQLPSRKKLPFILNEGICLCRYNEIGYGTMVKNISLHKKELIEKSVEILKEVVSNGFEYITCIDNHEFTKELASVLNIKYIDLIEVDKYKKQSEMENSVYQFANAYKSYEIKEFSGINKIIVLDSIINSGWSMTVVGNKLMDKGIKEVYPYVLASKAKW
ncbi:MAG: RecQ family ATP-dependent DNA helicase [bacterium]